MFDVGDRIIGLELPDTFYKLAELLEQDQFELLLSKNRIKDMHRKQDISLVYLMNDAVESFLVFHNATITGQYKSEYWLFLIKKKRSMFWSCIRETA